MPKEELDQYLKMVQEMNGRSRNWAIGEAQRSHDWAIDQSRKAFNRSQDLVEQSRQRNVIRQQQLQDLLASQRARTEEQRQRMEQLRQPTQRWWDVEPFKPPIRYEPPSFEPPGTPSWRQSIPPPIPPPEPFEPPEPPGPPPGWGGGF